MKLTWRKEGELYRLWKDGKPTDACVRPITYDGGIRWMLPSEAIVHTLEVAKALVEKPMRNQEAQREASNVPEVEPLHTVATESTHLQSEIIADGKIIGCVAIAECIVVALLILLC